MKLKKPMPKKKVLPEYKQADRTHVNDTSKNKMGKSNAKGRGKACY